MSVSIPILTNDPSLLIMFRIGCQKPPNQLINGCCFFLGMNAEKWRSAFCQKNIILPMTTLIDDVPIIIVLYSHNFHIEPKYKTCLSLWPSSLESGHFHQLGVGTMWSSLAVAVSDPMCRIPCSGWWLQIFLMCGLDFFFIPFPEKKTIQVYRTKVVVYSVSCWMETGFRKLRGFRKATIPCATASWNPTHRSHPAVEYKWWR